MNKVFLIGRLTRNPELRYTGSNVAVASFSLAVNRNYTNQAGEREADFINVVVWRKQAEVICNHFDKGNQIAIEGRIQTGSYDAQDGTKRYTTDVVCDNVTFLGTKASNTNFNNENYNSGESVSSAPTADVSEDPFKDFGSEVVLSDDDLPF